MKQKSQNRFLAALLAVAMMLQMLPMLAFADGAPGTGETYKAWIGEQGYPSLEAAVRAAARAPENSATITLGEGEYELYGNIKESEKILLGRELTFVGQGDKTIWKIRYNYEQPVYEDCDYDLGGAEKVTFENMKLQCGTGNYHGFARINNTVVKDCTIDGKTFYWGYKSAKFINTTFNAPSGDYAIWTYSSPTMEFDNCTFNATGKVINVYTDYSAGQHDIKVNFNNCTVNSIPSLLARKQALNINDSNMAGYRYIIHINNPHINADAARDTTTCSQMFGYGGKAATNNKGKTDVRLDGNLIWANGEMKTHSYTDGEHDKAFTYTPSEWKKFDERNEWRDVTKTCDYCHRELGKHQETASVYRLQYNLNGGTGDETAYKDAFSHEKENVTLAAAPTREGYQFAGWLSLNGKLYKAGSELELTGDEVFTAQWKKDEPVVNHTLTVTGGTFAVKNGDIDVTDTLETSTDEASGKQTCLVPDGAEVTVTLDQTKVPEGMVFDLWSTGNFDLPLDQDYKAEAITFTMNDDVDVAAQYRSADIEDGSDVVGPIIVGTAVVAGGALVGYTLGTDLVGKMWGLPYFPSNRSALAMMLWEDAGKPMPESEILYPDVGQEEQDMDLQHAARWAMEHDLLPDLNDQDTELPPEQVKFYPDNMVTKISVLRAWKKAQDLKQNAQ
ncbi:MAG: InlB B-repeat-containing protein [Faecalibacterium prausnitzii]|nr:InlB B-repeat-containing protein [Faecalibacterium prausnitzii]